VANQVLEKDVWIVIKVKNIELFPECIIKREKKNMLAFNKVHEDNRGEIYTIVGDIEDDEITILTCKKGMARGGCIHNYNDEYFVVIEGIIKYYIGDNVETFGKGMSGFIPSKTPHYFIAQKNSIVAEWGAKAEEKKCIYPATKKIVNKINGVKDV
jgi:mannose-6-phosphate isomerase-like protein (cupin superfamily)